MWGRCRAKLLRQGNKLFCRKWVSEAPSLSKNARSWGFSVETPRYYTSAVCCGGRRCAWKEVERFMLGCVDSRYV